VPLQFAADSLQLVGVADCPSCRDRPCRNGGICQSAATKTGYECQCAEGYSGLNCELIGTSCLPGNSHFLYCRPIQEIHNANRPDPRLQKYAKTAVMIIIISARQHICYSALFANARPSVCPSVRLSVTRVDQSKTVTVRITQPSPQSSPMTLVS